ncbi:c-type cytochrome [Bradyrhizobium sp. STM 3557]|uniref:c-type cytochrome n=1 Tax=Bradyrhizobium sp. STM 3557 TaxID=578920 RepID=UPI0038906A91
MTRWKIVAGAAAVLLFIAGCSAFALVWRPTIAAVASPSPASFQPDLIRRGRELAAIGNCNTCHTAREGRDFAGGLPVSTPFGTIFSTNISPDPDSGIGGWSEAAFRRAMRAGVDRDGHHLYPTFPYDHFTSISDEDDHALYAFLMTREPARAPARANELSFPYDQRWLIAGWKLLFFRPGTYRPEPGKSVEWNHGAYLVEGLAHCGACHTPRNALGAERTGASFSGGEVDNWQAYAINTRSPAPVHWDREALISYLRQGWHADHGTARGPMAEVVRNLSSVPASDVADIATYMADVFGPSPAGQKEPPAIQSFAGPPGDPGAAIYAAACASCHESARPLPYGGVDLARSTAISASDPRNLANIVMSGVQPVAGESSPIMPGFGDSMDDGQIVALLTYLRARFGKGPAWTHVEDIVKQARQTQTAYLQPSLGPQNARADAAQRDKP